MGDVETKNFNVLIDLDSILDTRLAIYNSISKDVTKDMLNSGYYTKRPTEGYKEIPGKTVEALYEYRDKSILKIAPPSRMLEILAPLVVESSDLMVKTGLEGIVTVYLNTYPYNLTEEETDNLVNMLCNKLPIYVDVLPVNMGLKEITPEWVNENVATIIKYDGISWVETCMTLHDLANNPMLDKYLIVPSIVSYLPDSNPVRTFQMIVEKLGGILEIAMIKNKYFNTVTNKKEDE